MYPEAYRPLTAYAGNSLGELMGISMVPANDYGMDNWQNQKVKTLGQSLADTYQNLKGNLTQSNQKLATDLQDTKDAITSTITQSTKDVKNNLSDDISEKLGLNGGTLAGDLTLKDKLKMEGNAYMQDVYPQDNETYDLGSVSRSWNNVYVHRLYGSSPIIVGGASSSHNLTGSGDLVISGGLEVNGAVYFDSALSMAGTINLNNYKITNLGTPTDSTDAANKEYVDNQIGGSAFLQRIATTISPINSGDTWDFASGILENIGNAGTDFNSLGGLTLANALVVSNGGANISGVITTTGGNSTNWNTAYVWGNHASMGYLTASSANTLTNKTWNGAIITSTYLPTTVVYQGNNISLLANNAGFITASTADNLTNKTGNISMWTNNVNYITDGNTNWDNSYGFITASTTDALTNKSGNISMWTNDVGYLTSASGGISGGGTAGYIPKFTGTGGSVGNSIMQDNGTALSVTGNINMTGSIIPTTDDTYSLGSPTMQWRDVYIGPGSVYVNGQEVLYTDPSKNVNIGADLNQGIFVTTYGSGDIQLNPSGTGVIQLKGDVQLTAGKTFRTSTGVPLNFSDGIYAGNVSLANNSISARNTNGSLELAANGLGAVYVTTGNFGLGTTGPLEMLDVNGRVHLAQTSAPGMVTDRLYNVGGSLFWNGVDLSTGVQGLNGYALLAGRSSGQTLYGGSAQTEQLTLIGNGATASGTDIAGGDVNIKARPGTGTGASSLHFFTGTTLTTGTTLQTSSEKMTILGNGNVGIGTTSPLSKLDIESTLADGTDGVLTLGRASNNSSGPIYYGYKSRGSQASKTIVQSGDETFSLAGRGYDGSNFITNSAISFGIDGTPGSTDIPGYIAFKTRIDGAGGALNEQMRITNAGNVGIGTTLPQGVLDLGSATSGRAIAWGGTAGVGNYANIWTSYGAGDIVLATGMKGTTTTADGYVSSAAASQGRAAIRINAYTGTGGSLHFFTDADAAVPVGTAVTPTERMTIDYLGNVGIGTTAPGAKLQITSIVDNEIALKIVPYRSDNIITVNKYGTLGMLQPSSAGENSAFGLSATSGDTTGRLSFGLNSGNPYLSFGDGTNARDVSITRTGANNLSITGNVGIGTTSPTSKLEVNGAIKYTDGTGDSNTAVCKNSLGQLAPCSSLSSLKNHVQDLSLGLTTLMQLRPVKFNWNASGDQDLGFLAEEVAAVNPMLAVYSDTGKLQGVKYPQLTALLTGAVQEQQVQITGLTDNQNKITEQLTGQLADESLSVNDKLNLIGENLDNLKQDEKTLADLKDQFEKQNITLDDLKSQISLLDTPKQAMISQISNEALINLVVALNTDMIIYKDATGNFDIGNGKMIADSIEAHTAKFSGEVTAGSFTVKVIDLNAPTIGSAAICPAGQKFDFMANDCATSTDSGDDGTMVEIKTTAVSGNSKIFVTAKDVSTQPLSVTKIISGKSFKVEIKDPVEKELKFDWWVVEEK